MIKDPGTGARFTAKRAFGNGQASEGDDVPIKASFDRLDDPAYLVGKDIGGNDGDFVFGYLD